jgi:hypothetical protein
LQEEEDRRREVLEAQIERAKAAAQAAGKADDEPTAGTELQRDANGQPLQIALAARKLAAEPVARASAPAFGAGDKADKVSQRLHCFTSSLSVIMCMQNVHWQGLKSFMLLQMLAGISYLLERCDCGVFEGRRGMVQDNDGTSRREAGQKKRSKLEEIMERDQAAKKAKAERASAHAAAGASGRQDTPWLLLGITVKVILPLCQIIRLLVPTAGSCSGSAPQR